jgi:hypothetical protein
MGAAFRLAVEIDEIGAHAGFRAGPARRDRRL